VPYVDEQYIGSVTGIVGAGGSVGAMAFGAAFRQLTYSKAFLLIGIIVLESTLLTSLITIKGYANLLWGEDDSFLEGRVEADVDADLKENLVVPDVDEGSDSDD